MKIAISVPDPVFKKVDRLAKKLRISRSRLYSRAAEEFLERQERDSLKASYDRLCAEVDTRPDPGLSEAVRRTLVKVEW